MSFDLDMTLMDIDDSHWRIRQAVEGVQIFGGIGSGKTTGSGRILALKYLSAGFGGLVLTVKPGEKELWKDYCTITNRLNDLLVIEEDGEHYFNFLNYEAQQSGNALTENIVDVLKTVIRASEEKDHGKTDDAFWETALDMLIFNVIDLCKLSNDGKVSIQSMFDIVQSLPKADGMPSASDSAFISAFTKARENIERQIADWELRPGSPEPDDPTYESQRRKAVPDLRLLEFIDQFFVENFMTLAEKTRSIVEFSFSGFLFRLLRDPVYKYFFSHDDCSLTPEDCLQGKIILINFPVKLYHKVGRDIQIWFKYIWQRAMEKRNIEGNNRPLFLWADEAQNFLHEKDADYQATARSSNLATVYLTQNLPNYYANMGGSKSEYKVKAFLGTLATKIFHANADIETNRYASELIGDTPYEDISRSISLGGPDMGLSRSSSLKIDRLVRPEQFVTLKTGGLKNEYKTEAYLHIQGNTISPDQSSILMQFDQNFEP